MFCHREKLPGHGCYGILGTQGAGITAFIPLAAQRCVLHRQGFSSSICQEVQWQLKHLQLIFTTNAGKNGQAGVLERVYQTLSFLLLN